MIRRRLGAIGVLSLAISLVVTLAGCSDATMAPAPDDGMPSPSSGEESTPAKEPGQPLELTQDTENELEVAALDPCIFGAEQINNAFTWDSFDSAPPVQQSQECEYENTNDSSSLFSVTVKAMAYGERTGITSFFTVTPSSRSDGYRQVCAITEDFPQSTIDPEGNSTLAHCDQGTTADSVNLPQNGMVLVFADAGFYEITGSGIYVTSESRMVADYPELIASTDSLRTLAHAASGQ